MSSSFGAFDSTRLAGGAFATRNCAEDQFETVHQLLERALPGPSPATVDGTGAAMRGIELHRLAERLLCGEQVEPTDEGHAQRAAQYARFLSEWRVEVIAAGRPAFSRTHSYAGTIDLLAGVPSVGLVLVAIRTDLNFPSPELALELAACAKAELLLDEDDNELAMPRLDACAVLRLWAGGYDLLPVEVTRREWRAFIAAVRLARWLAHRSEQVYGPALPARSSHETRDDGWRRRRHLLDRGNAHVSSLTTIEWREMPQGPVAARTRGEVAG